MHMYINNDIHDKLEFRSVTSRLTVGSVYTK